MLSKSIKTEAGRKFDDSDVEIGVNVDFILVKFWRATDDKSGDAHIDANLFMDIGGTGTQNALPV